MVKKTWPFYICCLLALAILLGAYSGYFGNSFHFDDFHVIQNNISIRSLRNLPLFFTGGGIGYRPLVSLTLAIDYALGTGLDPWPFHVTQFILLAVLGAMLFFFYRHVMDLAEPSPWNRYLSLFASLLFCIHTANTETMNIISARSELLSTIGIVGAFLLYFWAPVGRRFHLYLIPMILGALAKSPAVMFAPLLFLYLFIFDKERDPKAKLIRLLKATGPAFVVGGVLFFFLGDASSVSEYATSYGPNGRIDYLLTQFFVWLHYFRLFFLPVGLTADTDWTVFSHWHDTRIFAGILFVGVLLRFIRINSMRPNMYPVAFGLGWFLLALLPASSIFPLAEIANEHRILFPYAGLSLAVTWWTASKIRNRGGIIVPATWVLASLILLGHLLGTFERNKVWLNEETLWLDVTQKSPANGRALMNYGLTQMEAGKTEKAREYFEKALLYAPNYYYLEINLGVVYSSLGDFAKGESHFQRALQLNPGLPGGYHRYAVWLEKQGRIDDAISHLVKALEIAPGNNDAQALLMKIYSRRGDREKLKALVQQALPVWPDNPTALSYEKELENPP